LTQRRASDPSPAVLVLGFNRPDKTRLVLDAVREAVPSKVFFAVDGPRKERAGESARVLEVQSLAASIDWDCELRTLFRSANLGCRAAVSSAISWFFEEVEEGIVLEDDCVPHASFFPFAGELLQRYRHDERVMMISGDNFQFGRQRTPYSYYFSRYSHIWGWATWNRAWRLYGDGMSEWPELRDGGWLGDLFPENTKAATFWARIFEDTYCNRNDSWGYRWTFCCLANSGLTILPAVNLVSNIGFDMDATHTTASSNRLAALPTEEMTFPLQHPPFVIRDASADKFTQGVVYGPASLFQRARTRLSAFLRRSV